MRKLSMVLCLILLAGMLALPASAEGTYGEAPMLEKLVQQGQLPPVEERLPEHPKVSDEILDEYLDFEIGQYGGTLRLVTQVVNWDADAFVMCNEALLTMRSANSDEITPNIVEGYEASEDFREFTFTLRKGLRWSDGEPVTMEDYLFGFNDFVLNEELTPVVSAHLRSGGVSTGTPLRMEVVDDWTFKLISEDPYGGLAVHFSIAGWKGYTDILKPAHYLKRFHKDYAVECHGSEDAYWEFLTPYAKIMGYDDPKAEGIWVNVFNQVDCTNWECTDPMDVLTSEYFKDAGETQNIPGLYAWILKKSDGGVMTFERNPYYHKIDPEGNQLPYIDYVTSTLVEDMEMVQLKYMTGGADFGRESATIDNISLYKENEETAHITAYVTPQHNNSCLLSINVNYGLDAEGNVKDDEASRAWQEVATDVRFRRALMLSMDVDEIIDTVYKGFAVPNPYQECTHDIDQANALLDEMGMKDIDGDGFRETPSGLKLSWQIFNYAGSNDHIPMCELMCEFWSEIGLNASVSTIESTLMSTMREANEIPTLVGWPHTTQLWHYISWGQESWGPYWQDWYAAGGLNAEDPSSVSGLEPPEEVKEFYRKLESQMIGSPEEAVNEIVPWLATFCAENAYLIEPFTDLKQCVIINSDIGNVPTGGIGISWNFAVDQMFYRVPQN